MKRLACVIVVVGALSGLTACKKDPCADANFKLEAPKLCMKIPAGMKAEPAVVDGKGKVITINGDGTSFRLFWTKSNHEKDVDGYITQNVGSRAVLGQGAVPNREKAKFYHVTTGPNWGDATIYEQGKENFYECSANTAAAKMPPMVESCKTLWVE